MAQKIIKLTEGQLRDIVYKVISEQTPNYVPNQYVAKQDAKTQERIQNIANTLNANNGKLPLDYVTKYQIKPEEQTAAQQLIKQQQATQNTQNQRYVNIANAMGQVDPATLKIKSNNPKLNGMSWVDYMTTFKVTQDDITKAQAYVATLSKTNPAAATKVAAGVAAAAKVSKPDPKVMELQKQLKAAGYDLGTTGPNKDGIDGIMGSRTRAAQQQMASSGGTQMKSSYGAQSPNDMLAQNGQQFMDNLKNIHTSPQLTSQQQSDINNIASRPAYGTPTPPPQTTTAQTPPPTEDPYKNLG